MERLYETAAFVAVPPTAAGPVISLSALYVLWFAKENNTPTVARHDSYQRGRQFAPGTDNRPTGPFASAFA